MVNNKNRRRKLLINPEFQVQFMKNLLFLNLAICGVFYMAHAYFFWQARDLGKGINLDVNHVFFRFLDEQQRAMNIISLTTMSIISALILAFGLVYSHKIAGPVYRLRKYLRERAEGIETGQLRFREGDYFPEMADSVNDYINKTSNAKSKNKKAA